MCEDPFILAERVECQNMYNNFERTVQSNAQKLYGGFSEINDLSGIPLFICVLT